MIFICSNKNCYVIFFMAEEGFKSIHDESCNAFTDMGIFWIVALESKTTSLLLNLKGH